MSVQKFPSLRIVKTDHEARCGRSAVLAMACLGVVASLPSVSLADSFQWNQSDGGEFNNPANWNLLPGPATGLPGEDDTAAFFVNGAFTNSVFFTGDVANRQLFLDGGTITLDLAGHEYALADGLGAAHVTSASQPVFSFVNTSGTPARLVSGGEVKLSDNAQISVNGTNSFSLNTVGLSVGVGIDTNSDDRPDPVRLATMSVTNGATLAVTSNLNVGASSDGTLSVVGSTVQGPANSFYQVTIGAGHDITGAVQLDNSDLTANRIVVGGAGAGELSLSNNSDVTLTGNLFAGYQGGSGQISVVDSTLSASGITLNKGGGDTTLTIDNSTVTTSYLAADANQIELIGGSLSATTGSIKNGLTVGNGSGDAATFEVAASTASSNVTVSGTLDVQSDGVVEINGGAARFQSVTVASGGQFQFNAGSLALYGNSTDLTVTSGGLIGDNVQLSATGRVGLGVGRALIIDGAGAEVGLSSGGSLAVGSLSTINGGAFNWTGGTLDVNSAVTVDSAGHFDLPVYGAGTSLTARAVTIDDFTLTLDGGRLSTTSGTPLAFTNGGQLQFIDGQLTVTEIGTTPDTTYVLGQQITGDPADSGKLTLDRSGTADLIRLGSLGGPVQTLELGDGTELVIDGGSLQVDRITSSGATAGKLTWTGNGGIVNVQSLTLDLSAGGSNPLGQNALPFMGVYTVSEISPREPGRLSVAGTTTVKGDTFTIAQGRLFTGSLVIDDGSANASDEGTVVFDGADAGEAFLRVGDGIDIGTTQRGRGLSGVSGDATNVVVGMGDTLASGEGGDPALRGLRIAPGHTLTIDGGTVATGNFVRESNGVDPAGNIVWNSGTVQITGDFDPISSALFTPADVVGGIIALDSGQNLYVTGNTSLSGLSMDVQSGASFSTYRLFNGDVTGDGDIEIRYREITNSGGINSDIVGENINLAAAVMLNGHRLIGNVVIADNATLSGSDGENGPAIVGSVTNSGQLSPGNSPGELSVDGDYTQTSTGDYLFEFGLDEGLIVTDLLNVGGIARLSGDLILSYLDGLSAGDFKIGNTYQVVASDNVQGQFNLVTSGAALPSGLKWTQAITEEGLFLTISTISSPDVMTSVIPEPSALALMSAAGLLLRRRRSV